MKNLCNLCANRCNVDRNFKMGACKQLNTIKIAKYSLHPFEEPVISYKNGSGTVFFCGCSLGCAFCQNYELSRSIRGKEISVLELADIFKKLYDMGAENINLVTPTHFIYQIIDALNIYKPPIPIVYNTHSYESTNAIKLIDPFIDVYLADLKFFSPFLSNRYTGKQNYFEVASENIKFMMNSKKTIINNGKIKRGVIVRHLILPLAKSDSLSIIRWFNENKKNNAYLSLMAQYTPFGDINKYKELGRKITKKEYDSAVNEVINLNIENCFIQSLNSASEEYIPVWDY